MVLIHLLLLLLLGLSSTFSQRPPPKLPSQEICKRNPQHISSARKSGDNGYEVFVKESAEEYTPGGTYTIGIRSSREDQKFNGFMLTAIASNSTMEAMGTFMISDPLKTKAIRWCPHIISHKTFHYKGEVTVSWKAPVDRSVCVEFRATVLEKQKSWFKDEGKLTLILCPEDIPEVTEEDSEPCCACGSAKYEMTFEGIWSDKSHPINYPTQIRLLHWSNIVGASHNHKYHIWKYGGYASKGVKEICELGYPRTLEGEIKKQSFNIRTLIKTTGIWFKDQVGIVQNRSARFTTDNKRHLLSVISMLGPSPDWCVGINSVNVCQKDCSWSDGFVVDLTPWDAGTDDGISYMSPNAKSDPQKRIRKISKHWPNSRDSPFFGAHDITPVARIHVRKIGDTKPSDPEKCDESASTDFIGDGSAVLEQTISAVCRVTEWQDWSKCSVTCGVGTRTRRRMYKEAGGEGECQVVLLERENCIGIENECERIDEDCAMTQWSDWSPCSVTCGQGHREKIRYYFDDEDKKMCNRTSQFKEVCYAAINDCNLAKKTSAVCVLPKVEGACRGSFSKWYFDGIMKKCLKFQYGGCRGNGNNFDSMEECMNVCSGEEKESSIDIAFCMKASDRGTCGKHVEMWHFDKGMQKCLPFDYSGCGGNKNRFPTMDECSDACLLVGLEGGEGGDDVVTKCQQPASKGPCDKDLEKWYFDTQMQKCLPFQYGGCESNDNNFETMDECTEICTLNAQLQDALLQKAINPAFLHLSSQAGNRAHRRYKRFCTLPKERGPCRDSIERWHFDMSMFKCLPFFYGGCAGNANNFQSVEICKESCLGRNMTTTATHDVPAASHNGSASVLAGADESVDKQIYGMHMMGRIKKEKMKMKMKKRTREVKKRSCKVSNWSPWSACSSTCGRAQQMKSRHVVQKEVGMGRKCPRLMRKRSCRRLPACKTRCHYKPWSSWSSCSKSCGMASFKKRVKKVVTFSPNNPHRTIQPPFSKMPQSSSRSNHPLPHMRPHHSPKSCVDKLERRLCKLPKCPY